MLKETGSISKKEAKEIRNTENALKAQIEKLQEENKTISMQLQKKEMEAAMANKKLAEMNEVLQKSKYVWLYLC
jgi:outer membrane murein-binding lipoprotein Lpp